MLASEGVSHPEGIHGGTAQKFGKDRKKQKPIDSAEVKFLGLFPLDAQCKVVWHWARQSWDTS